MTTGLEDRTRGRLAGVSTATLTTVLFKRGLRNTFLEDVHPVNPRAPRMVGPAYTLRNIPAREDIDTLDVYRSREQPQRKAIEAVPPGHVLVIDSRRDARAATAGDILVTRLMRRGAAGIVTDGGLRDAPAIARLGFPAYHQRPSAPTSPILHHAADVGVPIGCGGVAVYPGDVMVGDAEGVVVIPAAMAAEVAEEAARQSEFEDWVQARVLEGRSIFGLYPPDEATRAEYEAWRAGRSGGA